MTKKYRSKKNRTLEDIQRDNLKLEIAEELGLTDKIKEVGWGGLTAKESGRIGGILTSKKKQQEQQQKNSEDS